MTSSGGTARRRFLRAPPARERAFLTEALRDETVGGALLLAGATIAVVWASSPWASAYHDLQDYVIGPSALHLNLTLEQWAADGLLAIFFFVAGLELKRELVVGQLRRISEAVLPVVAAAAGMVAPAVVYLAITWTDEDARAGWAVPMATDIAFALAVLAVIGSALPTPLRAFLLTLAIVDDLGAILVIALGFTDDLRLLPLVGAGILLAAYAWLQHRRVTNAWVLLPLALVTWVLVHDSGVHATVAGVALGLLTRVVPGPDERHSPAERLEHQVRPISAGVAVPIFALLSAGVDFDPAALGDVFGDVAAIGVMVGLVVGKFTGVLGGTWLTARWTRAELSSELGWGDVAGVALLAGIGFTVSLLLGDLAFQDDETRAEHVKAAVLIGSIASALIATVVLRLRQRHHRRGAPSRTDGAD